MSVQGAVRAWTTDLPPRTVFKTADVPGPGGAVETALSRLAADPDGPIQRVRRGWYWRKPAPTRFGSGRPDPATVAIAVAGPGSGLAGASAANSLGLSTQVPAVPTLAVFGRAPKGLMGVKVVTRSNLCRLPLNPTEVAALEVLCGFPSFVEASWPDTVNRIQGLIADGAVDAQRLAAAASAEYSSQIRDRVAAVVA